MSMSPSQLGVFARSDPTSRAPDVEYHVQPLSLPKFGEPLHPFDAFTASVVQPAAHARGSVASARPDPRPSRDRAQLSVDRRGPPRRGGVAAADPPHRRRARARASTRPRSFCLAGTLTERRGPGARPRATSAPPSSIRSARAAWAATIRAPWSIRACGARHRGPARRRRLGHAHHHVRQHQLADPDDRREGGRHDPRGSRG